MSRQMVGLPDQAATPAPRVFLTLMLSWVWLSP